VEGVPVASLLSGIAQIAKPVRISTGFAVGVRLRRCTVRKSASETASRRRRREKLIWSGGLGEPISGYIQPIQSNTPRPIPSCDWQHYIVI